MPAGLPVVKLPRTLAQMLTRIPKDCSSEPDTLFQHLSHIYHSRTQLASLPVTAHNPAATHCYTWQAVYHDPCEECHDSPLRIPEVGCDGSELEVIHGHREGLCELLHLGLQMQILQVWLARLVQEFVTLQSQVKSKATNVDRAQERATCFLLFLHIFTFSFAYFCHFLSALPSLVISPIHCLHIYF